MNLSNRHGWIGVDLGTRCVKLAQVVRTPSGLRLRHAAVIQRPVPWSEADTLATAAPDASYVEIRAALECSRFRGHSAACLLPMNVCELRALNIPHGTDEERRAMIANELADDWHTFPASPEFDFWELQEDRGSGAAEAFNVDVLAVTRPWVTQVARDCRAASLDCWGVDGNPTAMARSIQAVKPLHSGERILAIDWGYSNATLCVVGNGGPLYARRIHRCGLRDGLAAVVNTLGITLDHAQHLVDTQGVLVASESASGDREVRAAITTALADAIQELMAEVQRTLRFFDLQRRHLRPSSIWLMGGGASVRNIGPHLSQMLSLPVRVWDIPLEANESLETSGVRTQLLSGAVALSALAWRTT